MKLDGRGTAANDSERRYQAGLRTFRGSVVSPDGVEFRIAVRKRGFPKRGELASPASLYEFLLWPVAWLVCSARWVLLGRDWNVVVTEYRGDLRAPRLFLVEAFSTRAMAEARADELREVIERSGVGRRVGLRRRWRPDA